MKFLDKAYTKYNPAHKSWKNGLFSATLVLLFFLLFQPFGFRDKDLGLKLVIYPIYTIIAFLYATSRFYVIRKIIKQKKSWPIKNELLGLMASMLPLTFIIHLVTHWVTGDMPLNWFWYFKLLYQISSLFLIKAAMEVLYYSNRLADVKIEDLSSQVQVISQQLDRVKKVKSHETVSISLEKGPFEVNRSKLLFIQSVGNYLVFNLSGTNGQIKKLTKRGRIHQAEKDMEVYPEFFRCHRAFIVNLKQIKQMKGASKNARLVVGHGLDEIPVSRQQFSALKKQLDKIIAL